LFKKVADYVLDKNKEQVGNQGNRHAYAFKEVRCMCREESIASYMAYIQSYLMLEKTKKEDTDKEIINFKKFVLQVFIKGFDTFMKELSGGFALFESLEDQSIDAQELNNREKEIIKNISLKETNICPDNNAHIAFYIFCKMLNASHLSNLRNEIIKYRSARNTKEAPNHLLAIIELCMLSADVGPATYDTKEDYLNKLKPYFTKEKDISAYDALYMQADGTPIVHASVELAVKYGTEQVLKQVITSNNKFLIQKNTDFDKWEEMKSKVAEFVDKRKSLHESWEKLQKQEKKNFVRNHGQEYINYCKKIDYYNWLDNKLHFVHLKNLHNLTIEILGRLAGFTALFERDFQYICKNTKLNEQQSGLDGLDFENELPKEWKMDTKIADYLGKIFVPANYRQLRNYIAHFNFLTTAHTEQKYSIIDMINELRALFQYDRKLKNAVSKAIIDLFDRHGMILKLKLNEKHELMVESVESKQIVHLKDKKICTDQVHPVYCQMCRTLLELKKAK
jgi:hypothetical protein